MVRRHINKVKRVYTRARGILGNSNILQNPTAVGLMAGIAKNMINGQPPIDVSSIQKRITQPNAKNPLIYILAGYFLKNKPLMAIGAFQIVDPPVSENIDDMSDEEIKAMINEEEEVGENNKKVCIH